MNKYIWLIIVLAVIVGGGVAYKLMSGEGNNCPLTGVTRNITVTAVKDKWAFEPETIEVNCGDKVVLKAVNEDTYDHGIAIEQFGIGKKMPANKTVTFDFIAIKPGDFQFICSVPCGDSKTDLGGPVHGGKYDGTHRGHFDMIGTIKVKSLIQTQ